MQFRNAALFFLLLMSSCASSAGSVEPTELKQVEKIHTFRMEYANVHVIQARSGALTLVDSGYERNASKLEEVMRKHGLDPGRIKAVIVTHGHDDHAGGAPYFRERHGAKVVVGAEDRQMLAKGRNEHICPTGFMGRRLEESVKAERYTPYEADVWVTQPTPLQSLEAGLEGEVVPVAGHTPGHLVVVMGDVAFVGDLFRGSIVGSSAETHFFMCDLEDNRQDIQALFEGYPQVMTYFTGHFGEVSREAVAAWLDDV